MTDRILTLIKAAQAIEEALKAGNTLEDIGYQLGQESYNSDILPWTTNLFGADIGLNLENAYHNGQTYAYHMGEGENV